MRVGAAVSQAGVLALAEAARAGLGGTAVPGLVGGCPTGCPCALRCRPTPSSGCRSGCRCAACTAPTTTVPLSQSQVYVDAARAAGDDARLVRVPGDHFALIDPGTPAWRRTVEVLGALRLTPG